MLVSMYAGVYELRRHERKWSLLLEASIIGLVALSMGALVDRIGYGR